MTEEDYQRRRRRPDRASSVEDQLAEMRRTQADLQETINSQAATIQQLFKAQHVEHTEGDLSSTYEVIDEVLAKIGFDATKKACSWMNILPMTLQERKLMMREHGGTFSSVSTRTRYAGNNEDEVGGQES